jgi:hypothetical protein
MTIFDVLNMIGGLCLFLFGMTALLTDPKRGNPAYSEKMEAYSRKYLLPQK